MDYEHSIHPDESEDLADNVIGLLLRRCPNLKTLDAINHKLYADYVLAEPWVCRGLETLRCQIVGMERLKFEEEEDIYSTWESTIDRDEKEENERGSVEERPDARVMKIVKYQRRSHELHGRVFSRLGEMTQLKVLDLGYEFRHGFEGLYLVTDYSSIMQVDGRLYTDISPPIHDSLELTLVSGLDRLGALEDLEVFGFEGVNHRIGTKELAWMAASWPRLRIMRGIQEPPPYLKHGDDAKLQMLKDYMDELRPSVKHETIEEVHEMSHKHIRFWYTFD